MIEPNIILLSNVSLRFPLLGCCRQLYTNFFASPHTELLVFPRFKHGTTRYAPNLDSARLCQPASIVSACPRLLLFAIISAQCLYFSSTEVRSFSHHQIAASYPQVSLLRRPEHYFSISQLGHRIQSSLSSTKDSYLFNFQGTFVLKLSRTFYIYYTKDFLKNQIFTLKISEN